MSDSTIKKVSAEHSPKGEIGQKYLVSGKTVSMRLWEKVSEDKTPETKREYETVGYCLAGKASLYLDGQRIHLEKGDSWLVPSGAPHHYAKMKDFTALEATSPPARVHSRDEAA